MIFPEQTDVKSKLEIDEFEFKFKYIVYYLIKKLLNQRKIFHVQKSDHKSAVRDL